MRVEKTSLVAMLLEVGEENAAVLLARSDAPDAVDTERDLGMLLSFGLDTDQVEEVARLAIGAEPGNDTAARRHVSQVAQTISRRWADLVDSWTATL